MHVDTDLVTAGKLRSVCVYASADLVTVGHLWSAAFFMPVDLSCYATVSHGGHTIAILYNSCDVFASQALSIIMLER